MIPRMDENERARLEEETRAEFGRLDQQAEKLPGVLDLLKVYGGYDAAMRQVDAYLAAATPRPVLSTSNSSAT